MKWILILLILSVVVIYACKPTTTMTKETTKPTTKVEETTTSTDSKRMSIYQQLQGNWTMYKEICCGRKNQERKGTDMMFPKRLTFSDKKKVVILDLKTNEKKTATYKIEVKDNGQGTMITSIYIDNKPKGILQFVNSELVIDYGYMDLQKEFYQKSK